MWHHNQHVCENSSLRNVHMTFVKQRCHHILVEFIGFLYHYLKDMPCWLGKDLTFAKVKCLGQWRLDRIDRLICKRLIICLLNKTLTCAGVRWTWIVIVTFMRKMISAHHAQFLKSPIEDFLFETELIWLIW